MEFEQSDSVELRLPLPPDAVLDSRLRMAFPKIACAQEGWQTDAWIAMGTFSAQVAAALVADSTAQFPGLDVRIRSGEDPG